jgi:Na+/melibiose symporter-like transporter
MMSAVSGALGGIVLSLIGYDGSLGILSPETAEGMWSTFLLCPLIGMIFCLPVFYFYKLRDNDVQVMARYNQKEIT